MIIEFNLYRNNCLLNECILYEMFYKIKNIFKKKNKHFIQINAFLTFYSLKKMLSIYFNIYQNKILLYNVSWSKLWMMWCSKPYDVLYNKVVTIEKNEKEFYSFQSCQ